MAYTAGSGIRGDVSYNKDIILSVVKIATTEITGVSGLNQNFGLVLKRWFNNNYNEGVKIVLSDSVLSVSVYITVQFGYNVSEIAYHVQENIKNAVTSILGLELDKINVHVLGVTFKTDEVAQQQ